jgi:hypothetical protein
MTVADPAWDLWPWQCARFAETLATKAPSDNGHTRISELTSLLTHVPPAPHTASATWAIHLPVTASPRPALSNRSYTPPCFPSSHVPAGSPLLRQPGCWHPCTSHTAWTMATGSPLCLPPAARICCRPAGALRRLSRAQPHLKPPHDSAPHGYSGPAAQLLG